MRIKTTVCNKNFEVKRVGFYSLKRKIGEGGFSEVFEAIDTRNSKRVAIKVLSKQRILYSPQVRQGIKDQIKALEATNSSPHIVSFISSFKTNNNYYLVYELCNGGNLNQLIHKKNQIPQAEAIEYIRQILEGLKVLCHLNIVHRDIKPQNILIKNGKMKIADFGLCSIQNSITQTMDAIVGTLNYQSPQILQGRSYTSKCDIYSLGVVFYKMLFGKCPYESGTLFEILQKMQLTNLSFPNETTVSEQTKQILRKMLQKIEYKRLDWQQLFRHFSHKDETSDTTISQYEEQNQPFEKKQVSQNEVKPKNLVKNKSLFLDKIIQMNEQILNITKILLSVRKLQQLNYFSIAKILVIRLEYELADLMEEISNHKEFHQIKSILFNNYQFLKAIIPYSIIVIQDVQIQAKVLLKHIKDQSKNYTEKSQRFLIAGLIDALQNRFVLPMQVYQNFTDREISRRLSQL